MTNRPPKVLVIKSEKSELAKVEAFVQMCFDEYEIPQTFFNRVLLCVSEGVINSIEHGNNEDVNKEVTIFADCDTHVLVVKIKDEGEGFYIEEVADPTSAENIKKESGRGIHIIKNFAEHVDNNKSEICIQFKIDCK